MRQHYIDRLRNLGILFLLPYHTARVFDGYSPFYVKGTINTFSTVLIHASYWFMPLLFLLAGMSSRYALAKRSNAEYSRERVSRLLVPFGFGCLFLIPPQSFYAERFHRDYPGDYPEYLWKYFTDFSDWSEYAGGITPAHLWFLAFLAVISLALLPVMRRWAGHDRTPAFLRHPSGILLPFIGLGGLALIPGIADKNIFGFAGIFLLGFVIASDDRIADLIEDHRRRYLLMTIVGTAAILVEAFTVGRQSDAFAAVWHQLAVWVCLLAMLGYGRRFLNRGTRFTSYFTPAAMSVYLLHQTFLVVVAYYALRFWDGGVVPYLVIMLSTAALSLATYELVRRTAVTRFVFGLGPVGKTAPNPEPLRQVR